MLRSYLAPLAALIVLVASVIPRSASADTSSVFLTGYPLLRQQHSLTCEAAAASMGTKGVIPEAAIMAELPRDPNPNLGFRGNPDGEQGKTLVDYGVYAGPVSQALAQLGFQSRVLMYGGIGQIRHYVAQGWPVEVWISYALQRTVPRLAWAGGEQFFLVPHEHAVLVVGYRPGYLIIQDPWDGTRAAYNLTDFARSWGYFGDMALAIEPCPLPQPVVNLHIANLSSRSLKWVWKGTANVTYSVDVTQIGTGTVYKGTQKAHSYTIADPAPGARYRMTVVSQSSCGDSSAPVRLWAELPGVLPTPTPRPTAAPTETVIPIPSGTPVETAPATPAGTPSAPAVEVPSATPVPTATAGP